jgi:ferredoxin
VKVLIYYYSATGNTKLVCEYLAGHMCLPIDLVDIIDGKTIDIDAYDVVGFASPTDFWGIPKVFAAFIEGLPLQKEKPAFVVNTFGARSGKTLHLLDKALTLRGFCVLAGHSLRMPENYPPMIARGMGAESAPSPKRLRKFDTFIRNVRVLLDRVANKERIQKGPVPISFIDRLLPTRPRSSARKYMGQKFVDEALCTECGVCHRDCPYHAIRMEPKPLFDMNKCLGCWRCYNRCPAHAIYTQKYRGGPYYAGPNDLLKEKFSVGTQKRDVLQLG